MIDREFAVDRSVNSLFEPTFDAALNTLLLMNYTPWLICQAEGIDLSPTLAEFINNGKIVFNISPHAIRSLIKRDWSLYLDLGDRLGNNCLLRIPFENVIALVAKENPSNIIKFSFPKEEEIILPPNVIPLRR